MRKEFRVMLKDFAGGAIDDVVGLFEITQWIEKTFKVTDTQKLIEMTIEFVGDALDSGFKAGCSPYAKGGFAVWPNQNKQYVFDQIKTEWKEKGKPNLPTAIWFGLPGYKYD